jgi:hypothetical protein
MLVLGAVAGLIVGLKIGGMRAFMRLGQYEYRARRRNARI